MVCANKKIPIQIRSKLYPALQTILTFDLFAFLFEVYPALSHWVFSRNQNLVRITYMKLKWRALATFPDYNQQNIISPTNQYMETHPHKWYHPDSTKHAQTEQWYSCTGRSPQKEKKTILLQLIILKDKQANNCFILAHTLNLHCMSC